VTLPVWRSDMSLRFVTVDEDEMASAILVLL